MKQTKYILAMLMMMLAGTAWAANTVNIYSSSSNSKYISVNPTKPAKYGDVTVTLPYGSSTETNDGEWATGFKWCRVSTGINCNPSTSGITVNCYGNSSSSCKFNVGNYDGKTFYVSPVLVTNNLQKSTTTGYAAVNDFKLTTSASSAADEILYATGNSNVYIYATDPTKHLVSAQVKKGNGSWNNATCPAVAEYCYFTKSTTMDAVRVKIANLLTKVATTGDNVVAENDFVLRSSTSSSAEITFQVPGSNVYVFMKDSTHTSPETVQICTKTTCNAGDWTATGVSCNNSATTHYCSFSMPSANTKVRVMATGKNTYTVTKRKLDNNDVSSSSFKLVNSANPSLSDQTAFSEGDSVVVFMNSASSVKPTNVVYCTDNENICTNTNNAYKNSTTYWKMADCKVSYCWFKMGAQKTWVRVKATEDALTLDTKLDPNTAGPVTIKNSLGQEVTTRVFKGDKLTVDATGSSLSLKSTNAFEWYYDKYTSSTYRHYAQLNEEISVSPSSQANVKEMHLTIHFESSHAIATDETSNGTFKVTAQNDNSSPAITSSNSGSTVYVQTTPNAGYKVQSVKYSTDNGTTWTDATKETADKVYSFTMPSKDTRVKVDFTGMTFTVTFKCDESAGCTMKTGDPRYETYTQEFVYGTPENLEAVKFEVKDKSFSYWHKSGDLSTAYMDTTDFSTSFVPTGDNDNVDLYATWGDQTSSYYTVVFGKGSCAAAEGSMPSATIISDMDAALPTNAFKCAGYKFSQWQVKDNPMKTYKDNAEVKDLTSPGGTITLVAQWTPIEYKVAFIANAEDTFTGTMNDQTFTYDNAQKLSINTFEQKGYSFVGWFTDPAGTETTQGIMTDQMEVKNLTAVENEIVKLYAVWKHVEYNLIIKYVVPNGFEPIKDVVGKVFYGEPYSYNVPIVDGATPDMAVVEGTMPNENKTVVVTYSANSYKVSFSANAKNATGIMSQELYKYGETHTVECGFENPGYHFLGWAFTQDATNPDYLSYAPQGMVGASPTLSDISNVTTIDDAQVTLYAVWAPNTYIVQFLPGTATGSPSTQQFTYDVPQALSALTFEKAGYTFDGWFTKIGEKDTTFTDRQSVKNLTTGAGNPFVELTAHWTPIKYYVNFHMNDGSDSVFVDSVTYDDGVFDWTFDSKITREGYTFLGWAKAFDAAAAQSNTPPWNLTTTPGATEDVYAVWKINEYFLTVVVNGELVFNQNVEYNASLEAVVNGKLVHPDSTGSVPAGYTFFNKWTNMPELKTMPADNLTLVAEFKPNQFKVVFDKNTGFSDVNGSMGEMNVTFGSEQKLPPPGYTREGYIFGGWSTLPTEWDSYEFIYDPTTMAYADDDVSKIVAENDSVVTLYAMWSNGNYKVIFRYPRVAEDESDACKVDGVLVEVGENCVVLTREVATTTSLDEFKSVSQPAVIDGYTFSGWSGVPETMPSRDVIVSGAYNPNTYNVVFYVNNAKYDSVAVTFKKELDGEELAQRVIAPTVEGFAFDGWNWTDLPQTMPAENIHVDAVFDVNQWKVVFLLDDVEFGSADVSFGEKLMENTDVADLFGAKISNDSLTFNGWSELPETMPDENVTVTGTTTVNTFKVVWKVGEEIKKEFNVPYGTIGLEYDGETPTKPSTDFYVYTFTDWEADVDDWNYKTDPVYSNVVLTAAFKFESISSSSEEPGSSDSEEPGSSSSEEPGSSDSEEPGSSDSEEPDSSSSEEPEESSSSKKGDAIELAAIAPQFSVTVSDRVMQVYASNVGAKMAVFDMQGRVITAGRVETANFNVALPHAGKYMLRVGSQVQMVTVK